MSCTIYLRLLIKNNVLVWIIMLKLYSDSIKRLLDFVLLIRSSIFVGKLSVYFLLYYERRKSIVSFVVQIKKYPCNQRIDRWCKLSRNLSRKSLKTLITSLKKIKSTFFLDCQQTSYLLSNQYVGVVVVTLKVNVYDIKLYRTLTKTATTCNSCDVSPFKYLFQKLLKRQTNSFHSKNVYIIRVRVSV